MEELEVGEILGVGTFGRVRLVRLPRTDQYFALKTLKKAKVTCCPRCPLSL
jgi:serine/threonine protein kinase